MPCTLKQKTDNLKKECGKTADLAFSEFSVGGISCALVWFEGMIKLSDSFEMVYKKLFEIKRRFRNGEKLFDFLMENKPVFLPKEVADSRAEYHALASGELLLFIDGCARSVSFPMQGYNFRAISESYTEENVRASREGFAEPLKVNMTIMRRRLKTEKLRFEIFQIGKTSKTDVAIVYLDGYAPKMLVEEVKNRIKKIDIDIVLESGFIEPFFKRRNFALFSEVGHTERPDTLCAKISEGRVGVLVDGTPFALVMPYLFMENFQSFDDYTEPAYFASGVRILKILCFVCSVLLPGIYVALARFNPELLPELLLKSLVISQLEVAMPILAEALFINIVYEIVREAGLRLPRPIGHAVSLIGGLVVGETAISAGLVGAPLVMMAALTTVCSFVVSEIYKPITALRLSFIMLGGLFGISGIAVGVFMVTVNICSVDNYSTPFLSPLVPYSPTLFKDSVLRKSWRVLSTDRFNISMLRGRDEK